MGKAPKFTPQEAKERKKQSTKISKKKHIDKVNSNPKSKKKAMKKQVKYNKKYLAKIPPEKKREKGAANQKNYRARKKELEKQLVYLLSAILKIRSNKASTNYHKELKAKKENKPAKIPSQTALSSVTKPIQLKVSSEQSAEIGIQKNASLMEAKKTVHSIVETV